MLPDLERIEVRLAPGGAGTFRGLASVHGVVDGHGTDFAEGCFDASIEERRARGQAFPLLLHHDPARPCGAVTSLTDTPEALTIEGRFALGTLDGDEAHTLAKTGALALSVGFVRRLCPGG